MKDNLTDILASCLNAMEQKGRTVEECLALYPEHQAELELLLRTAAVIWRRADFSSRPSFRLSSRARLFRRLDSRHPAPVHGSVHRTNKPFPLLSKRLITLWTIMLALILSLIGSGTVYASSNALPGDALYPLKLSIEDAQLLIANDEEDVLLVIEFTQTRMEEIEMLIQTQREEDLNLAVEQFANNIFSATEAVENIAQHNPERAAQLALTLEQALTIQAEVLSSNLDSVPDQVKPVLEYAIFSSNEGQKVLRNLFQPENRGEETSQETQDLPPTQQPSQHGNTPPPVPPSGGPPDDAGPPPWIPSGGP